MIDWISGFLPLQHKPIKGLSFTKTDESTGELLSKFEMGRQFEGSASNKLTLRTEGDRLFFSGNPAKFLQGHNLFGIDDPKRLMFLAMDYIYKNNILEYNYFGLDKALNKMDLTRVDINNSYGLSTQFDVTTTINSLHHGAKSRHGKATRKGDTVYLGQSSTLWSFKGYDKLLEILTRKEQKKLQQLTLEQYNLINKRAKNIFRFELTLRGKELKKLNLRTLENWNKDTAQELFNEYKNKLDITANIKMTTKQLEKLPLSVRNTYNNWKNGEPLEPGVTIGKGTFYRHKKILMDYGININIVKAPKQDNTVPFVRILELKPLTFDKEFLDLGLIAQ
jgi:II/X family phage/plasmid replication protein